MICPAPAGVQLWNGAEQRIQTEVRHSRVKLSAEAFYEAYHLDLAQVSLNDGPLNVAFKAGVSPPAVSMPMRFISRDLEANWCRMKRCRSRNADGELLEHLIDAPSIGSCSEKLHHSRVDRRLLRPSLKGQARGVTTLSCRSTCHRRQGCSISGRSP